MHGVVQLLVRLLAPPGREPDVVAALRVVLRPAQLARGCRFAQIYQWAADDRHVEYVEEWDDPLELRGQVGSERFVRLLELLEMAAERPLVEFRIISETHGIEYLTTPPDVAERVR